MLNEGWVILYWYRCGGPLRSRYVEECSVKMMTRFPWQMALLSPKLWYHLAGHSSCETASYNLAFPKAGRRLDLQFLFFIFFQLEHDLARCCKKFPWQSVSRAVPPGTHSAAPRICGEDHPLHGPKRAQKRQLPGKAAAVPRTWSSAGWRWCSMAVPYRGWGLAGLTSS